MNFFEEFFWCGNETLKSISILHQKIQNSQQEHLKIISFLQNILQTFQHFSTCLLQQQSTNSNNNLSTLLLFKNEFNQFGSEVKTFCLILKENCLDSLNVWLLESGKVFLQKKGEIEFKWKKFENLKVEVDKKKRIYDEKFNEFIKLEKNREKSKELFSDDLEELEILFSFNDFNISQSEFWKIVKKCQTEIELKEVTKYPFSLLGKLKCFAGKDFCDFLINNKLISKIEFTESFGCLMVEKEVVKLVGGLSNKFVAKENWYYQWVKSEDELLQEKLEKIKIETEEAKVSYKSAVEEAEEFRIKFEQFIFEHLGFLQNLELSRIGVTKQALNTLATATSSLSDSMKGVSTSILVGLETVLAEKEVVSLCENYKSGCIRPFPILYKENGVDLASTCLFGVALDELCKEIKVDCPWIVSSLLEILKEKMDGLDVDGRCSVFLQSLDVSVFDLYKARKVLNLPHQPFSKPELQNNYSLPLLIAILRRYFMELPVPLLMYEEYESFKTLYLSNDHEISKRNDSVRELITTLSPSHFHTLKLLIETFNKLFICDGDVELRLIKDVVPYWGCLLLRPKDLVCGGLDRHQDRLLKDLVVCYDDIFLGGSLKPAFSEGEINRETEIDKSRIESLRKEDVEPVIEKTKDVIKEKIKEGLKHKDSSDNFSSVPLSPEESEEDVDEDVVKVDSEIEDDNQDVKKRINISFALSNK